MPLKEVVTLLISRLNQRIEYQDIIQELIALGSSAVPSLIYVLTNKNETLDVHLEIAHVLGKIRDERAIAPILSVCTLANKEGASLDYLLIPALTAFGSQAVPYLIAALTDRKRDIPIRATAAWALGTLGDPHILELLIQRLVDVNEASNVRSYAANGLGALGDKHAVIALMKVLSLKTDEDLRRSTITALGQLKDQRAVEPLIVILQADQNSGVRDCAARALGLIGDERAISPLIEAVIHLRGGYLALEALAQFGDSALQLLLHTLQNTDYKAFERGELINALGYFKQEEAFTKLLAVLNDENEEVFVRMRAVWALGLHCDPRASGLLRALLANHEGASLRIACAYVLGGLKDRQALPVLQGILQQEIAAPEASSLKRAVEMAIKMINH